MYIYIYMYTYVVVMIMVTTTICNINIIIVSFKSANQMHVTRTRSNAADSFYATRRPTLNTIHTYIHA